MIIPFVHGGNMLIDDHARGHSFRLSAARMRKLAAPTLVQAEGDSLRIPMKSNAEACGDLNLTFGDDGKLPAFAIPDITGHGVSAAQFSV